MHYWAGKVKPNVASSAAMWLLEDMDVLPLASWHPDEESANNTRDEDQGLQIVPMMSSVKVWSMAVQPSFVCIPFSLSPNVWLSDKHVISYILVFSLLLLVDFSHSALSDYAEWWRFSAFIYADVFVVE